MSVRADSGTGAAAPIPAPPRRALATPRVVWNDGRSDPHRSSCLLIHRRVTGIMIVCHMCDHRRRSSRRPRWSAAAAVTMAAAGAGAGDGGVSSTLADESDHSRDSDVPYPRLLWTRGDPVWHTSEQRTQRSMEGASGHEFACMASSFSGFCLQAAALIEQSMEASTMSVAALDAAEAAAADDIADEAAEGDDVAACLLATGYYR